MKRAWGLAAACGAVAVALEFGFRHELHAKYPWHEWPGFDLVFGLLGCALIVVASKWLGRTLLQRPEDFYGDGE